MSEVRECPNCKSSSWSTYDNIKYKCKKCGTVWSRM